jgi:hypothetical protein
MREENMAKLTLKALQSELEATQYWLRYLFVMSTSASFLKANTVLEQIQAIKNHDPSDFPEFGPGDFDRAQLELVPYIEKVGRDIAAYLGRFER